jgi:DNA polymerase III epsilon subunit-like protein
MTVRIIDIETTGTDPATDAIIEIASVDLLKDGTITNQRSTLVRPPIPVPPESSAVHHLIDEDLAFAPQLDEHRGERFDAVPLDYLQWIVEGSNELSKDVKASAQYWLARCVSGAAARLPGVKQ